MRKTFSLLLALAALAGSASAQNTDDEGNPMVGTNFFRVLGVAPGATNPVPARLTDGTAFYVPALDTTLTARLPTGSTPADNESNTVTTTRIGSYLFCFDGTTWDRCPGTAADGLLVNLGANNDVTGTVTANAGTGTFVVGDGAGALNTIVDSSALPTGASTLAEQQTQTTALQIIDNLPVTQGSTTAGQSGALSQGAVTTAAPTYTTGQTNPISLQTDGSQRMAVTNTPTVTANAGTNLNTSALALEATLGTRVADATVTGRFPAGSTPADNESNTVTITRIGSFLWCFDGTTWDRCPGNSADGLLVNLGTNNDVTVTSGTVTCNAGTNLNTSALALDATLTGRLPAGSTPADNESNTVTITRIGSFLWCFDGTTWDRCPGTAADGLLVNLGANNDVTIQSNAAVNQAQVGGSAVVADPCMREARIPVSISQTAGTQLITGTASERIFICSIHIVTATAQNIALVSGTGTVCATSTSGVVGFGGATAATGWNFAANGGIQMGHSNWSYGKTDTDADNVCLLNSGSGQISGGLTYVSAANF